MGRGKAESTLALIDAAYDILEEIQPATVRAVCYRLFTQGLIASMAKTETNRVSRQLTEAREDGTIPWSWIVDETREAERTPSWDNPAGFVESVRRAYRKDHWALQRYRVEVWSEKGTVRGTLAPVLNEYGVTFRVMHGYASATAVRDIADQDHESKRLLIALYCGDFDPSGMHMSELDLPRRLDEYGADIDLQRVALTAQDTRDLEMNLPSFDLNTKLADPRARWFHRRYGTRCWELDALSPPVLRDRMRRAISALIDRATWERSIAAEQLEAESLRTVLDRWGEGRRAAESAATGPEANQNHQTTAVLDNVAPHVQQRLEEAIAVRTPLPPDPAIGRRTAALEAASARLAALRAGT